MSISVNVNTNTRPDYWFDLENPPAEVLAWAQAKHRRALSVSVTTALTEALPADE